MVIAITIPIRTNTTIATCIQIHVGDIHPPGYCRAARLPAGGRRRPDYRVRMPSPSYKLLLALLLALCAAAWPAAAGQARTVAGARLPAGALLGGVNIGAVGYASQPAEADRAIASAAALHASVIRVDLPWAAFEPLGPERVSTRAQAYADRLASDAAAAGIRLIVTVESTPCWASSAPSGLLRACRTTRATRANSWPPRNAADYAAFTAYLAGRYGPQIAAIEVWNEPDQANEDYFAGPDKAARYAAVLRAAYPAIKRADPKIPVLAGSLVGSNGNFLRALYAAGIKGFYDGLSVHFYNLTLASLRSIHEVQLAAGDTKPLWLDEFGWTSCWPRQSIQQEQACVTAGTQAVNLTDTLRTLAHSTYVAAAVVYKLADSQAESFGLTTASGSHKPAFAALAKLLRHPTDGRISPVTLTLRSRGSQVLAAGSGPVGDYMLLEAFQGSLLRYRAVFTLDRFNRYSIALPAVLGTHGLRVRVYQYWTGPGRSAQRSI